MEKELKTLFEYQRFEQNERLEKMIRRAETAYPEELTELELELVAGGTGAAGMRSMKTVGGMEQGMKGVGSMEQGMKDTGTMGQGMKDTGTMGQGMRSGIGSMTQGMKSGVGSMTQGMKGAEGAAASGTVNMGRKEDK